MPDIQIFAGFGGSGGKTLATLASYIADDALLADRAERHFFFLLVDTDEGDIKSARQRILDQFKRVAGAKPHVETLRLSDGVGRVMDVIDDSMGEEIGSEIQSGRRSPKLELLRKHWPFDSDGVPFSAPRLPVALSKGASQCPLAAHLAAWDSLSRGPMTTALQNIQRAIIDRLHEVNDQTEYSLLIVGSLAGGTGRGCWQLLSLAARSMFRRCKPQGYFFDSTVFANRQGSGRERYRKHVNSLTGLSEIAGWIRNDLKPLNRGRAANVRFALPNLQNADMGQMVVDTNAIASGTQPHLTGRSPIDGVFIITGASDALAINRPEDAYEIAAAAIFARVAITDLESRMANDLHLGSCGAAIAKVPITDIAGCVKQRAQLGLIDDMIANDSSQSGRMVDRLTLPLRFNREEIEETPAVSGESFVSRIASHLSDSVDVGAFSAALKAGKQTKDVLQALEGMTCMRADRQSVLDALNAAVIELLEVSQAADALQAFRAALERELECLIERKVSVGTMAAAADLVATRIETLRRSMPGEGDLSANGFADAMKGLSDALKQREGRAYGVVGTRWTSDEQAYLEGELRSASLKVHHAMMVGALADLLDQCHTIALEYVAVLRPAMDALRAMQGGMRTRFEAQRGELFLPSRFSDLQHAFGHWTSKQAKALRILRPALDEKAFESIIERVSGSGASATVRTGVAEFREDLKKALFTKDRRQGLRNEVMAAADVARKQEFLVNNVFNALEVPDALLRQHFGITAVVRGIESHVRQALNTNVGDAVGTEALQDSFEAMFGVRFRKARNAALGEERADYQEIPTDVLLQQLGYSLARIADPMFVVDRSKVGAANRGEIDLDAATTYFPSAAIAEFDAARFLASASGAEQTPAQADRQHENRTKVHRYNVEAANALPYCILAHSTYTIPGFEDVAWDPVKSFDFWRQDPEVLKWVTRCETREMEGVWSAEDGNFGLGYMHPMFVEAPWKEVRSPEGRRTGGLRWAPWGVSAAAIRKRADELDAILYALAGNLPKKENAESRQAREVLAAVGAREPSPGSGQLWTLPLLRRGDGADANAWVLGRKTFVAEAGSVMATGGCWGARKTFSTFAEFIRWIGGPDTTRLTDEGRQFIEAVNAERRLLHAEVIREIEDDFAEPRRVAISRGLMLFIDGYKETYLAARTEEQRNKELPLLNDLRERISAGQWSWDRPPSV
jgi:hypothetical protein